MEIQDVAWMQNIPQGPVIRMTEIYFRKDCTVLIEPTGIEVCFDGNRRQYVKYTKEAEQEIHEWKTPIGRWTDTNGMIVCEENAKEVCQ